MANIYDLIAPVELTGVARLEQAAEDWEVNRLQLGQWFPNDFVPRIDFAYATGTDRTYSESAQFRAFDERPRLGTRPGITRIRGELPPISMEYVLTEYDQIQLMAIQNGGEAQLRELVEPVVTKDIIRGVAAIERRMEFVRRDMLVDGTADFNEGGMSLTLDTGRDAGRSSTVSTGWDVPATATPITDERAVVDTMIDEENIGPTDLIAMMNTVTWRAWKLCQEVEDQWDSVRVRTHLNDDQANQIRRDNELPAVVINDSRAAHPETGVTERLIPDYKVLYLPRGAVGSTQYGIPAITNDPDVDIPFAQRPGPVAYLTREVKPSIVSTVVDALGLPLLKDPDATYALDVKP